jgi:polysaccharide export outer membrane protein
MMGSGSMSILGQSGYGRTSMIRCGICLACAVLVFGAGCKRYEVPTNEELEASGRLAKNEQAAREYLIDTGDTLEVKFFYNPELDTTATVRPDGKISLQLVGELMVAGRAPSELETLVVEKYSTILKNPKATVNVTGFGGWKVFVGGEVMSPGIVSLSDASTVFQALLVKGGLRETANAETVLVVRRGPDGSAVARSVNLSGVVTGEALDADIALQPLDIVFVPKTPIAEANKFVSQYIKQILPFNMQAAFAYSTGKVNLR